MMTRGQTDAPTSTAALEKARRASLDLDLIFGSNRKSQRSTTIIKMLFHRYKCCKMSIGSF